MRCLRSFGFVSAAAGLLSLAALGTSPAAHAETPAVVYLVNGILVNQDYFGGGGLIESVLPTTVGDNLSFAQTLVNPAGTSETSLSYIGTVAGNVGTFSTSFSSLAQRAYAAEPQFFIYYNRTEIAVDAYVLGEAGTPYQLDVTSTGFNDSINSEVGSYSSSATSAGQAFPGQSYYHPNEGGTYSETAGSSNTVLTYLGNTYSRINTGPRGLSSTFFGITGTPDTGGFTRMSASHSFTFTVTNLAVAPTAAPEPGTFALLGTGLVGFAAGARGLARRRRFSLR